MPDWTKSMEQTFKYYIVDPDSWQDKEELNNILSGTIEWDADADTLGSATFDISDTVGECYIRPYLITRQNGITERFPLGTFLIQTQKTEFDGKYTKIPVDAYTPLLELKENPPPLGYSLLKNSNIMEQAYMITREHVRAPVIQTSVSEKLYSDFVANTDDTWLTYIDDLISNAKYKLGLDELGRVLFLREFNDDDGSILYPDISTSQDMYGIPNVVEVSYSSSRQNIFVRAVNNDPNSPVSTVSRGREIIHRVSNPDFAGEPTKQQIQLYAKTLLDKLSTIEYTVTFSHGYCPKIVKQKIKCAPGCKVTETAVFTKNLWR